MKRKPQIAHIEKILLSWLKAIISNKIIMMKIETINCTTGENNDTLRKT